MQNSAFKVGVFVTVSAVTLGGVILFFGEIPFLNRNQVDYYAYFKNVGGLSVGSDVRVSGVKVGKVKSITFENGKVKVTLQFNKKVPIYRNAIAKIESLGLLGDKYVEINPGTPSAGPLPPGSVIKFTQTPADVTQMIDTMTETAKSIEKLSNSINQLVAENRKQLHQLLFNLNKLSAKIDELLNRNGKNIDKTLQQVASLTEKLNRELPKLIKNLNGLTVNLNSTVAELKPRLKQSLDSISKLSSDLDTVAKALKNQRQSIEKTLQNLSKITSDISHGRGTLGKLVTDKTLYKQLKKSVKLLGEASEVLAQTKLHVDAWAQYEGKGDSKAGVNLILQPDNKKYYLFGIVGDSAGKVTKKTYYYNGTITEVTEKDYKPEFTIQYARIFPDRWLHPGSSFVIRFGLKESTGGVGFDYVYNERLMFTSDIWDFGREDKPNEKLKPNTEIGFKYMFYGPFFVKAGGYDLLNSRYRTFYVGGGMSFTDNDLKYLLGGMKMPSF